MLNANKKQVLNGICDNSGSNILMLLAKGESRSNLVKLIKSKIDSENKKDKILQNLIFSINFDDSDIIIKKIINDNLCDINLQNKYGETALMLACVYDNEKCFKLLLMEINSCDVNLKDNAGNNVLMLASMRKSKYIKLLMENKLCDINLQNNEGFTALMLASTHHDVLCAKLLMENKLCDMNLQNNDGNTALIIGSIYCHNEIVISLIENKCDINIKNNKGETALMHANKSTIKLFTENDMCDLNAQDNNGNTILMKIIFATMRLSKLYQYEQINDYMYIFDTVASKKSYCINIQNNAGETILMVIIKNKNIIGHSYFSYYKNTIIIHHRYNYNYNLLDNEKATVLSHLLMFHHLSHLLCDMNSFIKKTIELTHNVHTQDIYGTTPLMRAILTKKNVSIVQKIIDISINNKIIFDLQDNYGETALIHAIQNKKFTIAKILINNGCNINIENNGNKTAFWYSIQKESLVITNMFIDLYIERKDMSFLEYQEEILILLNSGTGMLKDKMRRTFKKRIINLYEIEFTQIINMQNHVFSQCYKNLGDLNTITMIIQYLI